MGAQGSDLKVRQTQKASKHAMNGDSVPDRSSVPPQWEWIASSSPAIYNIITILEMGAAKGHTTSCVRRVRKLAAS